MEINKIYNEDCLSGMQKIPDKTVDCIICDLPYGKLKGVGTLTDWDVTIPFEPLWEQYNRIAKENAAVLLFGVEPFTSYLVLSNINNYRQKLTWLKSQAANWANCNRQFLNLTEDILVFYRKSPTFNPQLIKRDKPEKYIRCAIKKGIWTNAKIANNDTGVHIKEYIYPKPVLKFGNNVGTKERKNFFHPTQKPVDLIRYLIRTYTNPGDLVLDNCMGSGTTAIAAMREGRNFIGFELDDFYYDMCLKRIEEEKDYIEEQKKLPKSQPLF